jgi:hypothetical protein
LVKLDVIGRMVTLSEREAESFAGRGRQTQGYRATGAISSFSSTAGLRTRATVALNESRRAN